ncbi:DUF397 domain-containing protein [Streptomyces sp. XD-27]|uniref:DUF397 domain-containing protein n=1 Tax=Streptomyces sp. XD-27 TaxID=3062779 RepID=UPI0026F41273|nr:DUF397 domain-containing protein [Streptomyces sp. XD-27]WKX71870.1 DUF397 domain-containing protein [Streptomyces sp. XD-27]
MPTLEWQKSSYCQTGNNCLNVAAAPDDTIHLRESEHPGTVLAITPGTLRGFIRAARAGRFDRLADER